MRYYAYILKSLKDGKCYTGITNDLIRRINQHQLGDEATPSTLNRGPFKLIHAEECENRLVARKREKYWKSGYGRELRERLFG